MSILNEEIHSSPTILKYKDTMSRCVRMYYPEMDQGEIDNVLDYSISKRYKQANAQVSNSYTHKTADMTLLAISDYIASREPIVTAFGTMFRKHADVPNPMGVVVQSFLDKRSQDKKMMFKYPKGSEMFEKYNLLQSLDKIDANGIYGVLGMYTSLLYNINVATSITSQGRALVSSASMQFEMFLANNVKFGSLNEVLQFIDNIVQEKNIRKFRDVDILDTENQRIKVEDCFAKIILTCGYRWIPNDEEMDIIWRVLNNLSQEDINRIYYKNNLYEFLSNSKVFNMIESMLKKLKRPMFNSLEIPEEIAEDIKIFGDILMEYIYYKYMIIDRIDRCDNMIKSVIMVSDTDSTIISLDAWYRFVVEKMNGQELRIANYCKNPVSFIKKNEFGDWESTEWRDPVEWIPKKLDYNFATDEIVEMEHQSRPDVLTPNDNVRYSIINILAYVLDRVINDYMEQFCLRNHSITFDPTTKNGFNRPCKILMKNEFTFLRLMMTLVKKNYASLIGVQEGNIVPENKQLDIKGIECLTKSSKSEKTREALKKILLEDILRSPAIDQLRFVKDIAIFEKQIVNSLRSGSKEYYKPVTIKSINSYDDPMRIQGIKASLAWNIIRPSSLPAINLEERNAVNIAKISINMSNIDKIKDTFPEVYQNMLVALSREEFGANRVIDNASKQKYGSIDAIAIPLEVDVPEWLNDFINYTSIISDNLSGFPYESIGIMRMDKPNITYSNIVKL